MPIYVYRPEGNLGPYSPFDLRSMVQDGLIRADELGWQEGMAEWRPLSTFVPLATLPPVPAPPPIATVRGGGLDPFLGMRNRSTPAADEGMRREYLSHEATVKSLGLLYYLGAAAGFILFALAVIGMIHATRSSGVIFIALLPVLAVINLFLGFGLRRLNPKVVIPVTILSALGLLAFPAGTLINGYILFLIWGEKGKVVFSSEYRAVIAATPHIRYRTSPLIMVVFVLLLLFFGYVIVSNMLPNQ